MLAAVGSATLATRSKTPPGGGGRPHRKALAVLGAKAAAFRPPVARASTGPGPRSTVTEPSSSVRKTCAPAAVSRSTVAGAGWPYGLPRPAEITAMPGRVVARNAAVDDVLDP